MDRCHYTDVFLREVSLAETLRKSLESMSVSLEVFDNDAVVSVETLIEAGIVKHARDGVKILGNGELNQKAYCSGKCIQRRCCRKD